MEDSTFEATPFDHDWEPRYNVAPTQSVPVIRQHPKEPQRVLSLMRWGLIPSWAKDISGSASMINARAELGFGPESSEETNIQGNWLRIAIRLTFSTRTNAKM